MRRDWCLCVAPLLALLAVGGTSLFAGQEMTKDDVVKLASAGVGDEVIICKIKADGAVFDLSTDDILALKQAKVSDAVIAAMLRTKTPVSAPTAVESVIPVTGPALTADAPRGITGSSAATTAQPATDRPEVSANEPLGGGFGSRQATVLFSNQTGKKLSVLVDEINGRLTYFPGTMPHMIGLALDEVKSVAFEPGEYTIRWTGKSACLRIQAPARKLVKLAATAQRIDGRNAVLLTVFEGDVAVDSAVISDEPAGRTLSGSEASLPCKETPIVVRTEPCAYAAVEESCPYAHSAQPAVVNNYNYYGDNVPAYAPTYPGTIGPSTGQPTFQPQWVVPYQPYQPSQWDYVPPQVYYQVVPEWHHRPSWGRPSGFHHSRHRDVHHYRYESRGRQSDYVGNLLTPNTILWGGVGALIGDRKNKAGQGAAIGAAFGLLLDGLAQR